MTNAEQIIDRHLRLKNELIGGGYNREFLHEHIEDVLAQELAQELVYAFAASGDIRAIPLQEVIRQAMAASRILGEMTGKRKHDLESAEKEYNKGFIDGQNAVLEDVKGRKDKIGEAIRSWKEILTRTSGKDTGSI